MSQRNPNNDRSQKQRTEGVSGMTRKGASRAKPVSQAGSTVQVVERRSKTRSKANPATLSKEETKELKRRERDERDRVTVVSNILQRQDPAYAGLRRLWWILLGAGLAFTAVSWICMFIVPGASSDPGTPMGMAAMVCIILAYVCIIGGFIFDWVKVRPIRRKIEATVAGMTEKRMQQIVDDDFRREEEARLAREQRKRGTK